ncbi:hypothetical protein GCM10022292_28300 [Winogradskyella damuponensis]|uniref:Uncharacterized protein n=1 Tax=Winogradskyella damuponensis TaxID=943939 RepID=A0ABP8D083_9FLAO
MNKEILTIRVTDIILIILKVLFPFLKGENKESIIQKRIGIIIMLMSDVKNVTNKKHTNSKSIIYRTGLNNCV